MGLVRIIECLVAVLDIPVVCFVISIPFLWGFMNYTSGPLDRNGNFSILILLKGVLCFLCLCLLLEHGYGY